jgi:hypothetical protein
MGNVAAAWLLTYRHTKRAAVNQTEPCRPRDAYWRRL